MLVDVKKPYNSCTKLKFYLQITTFFYKVMIIKQLTQKQNQPFYPVFTP